MRKQALFGLAIAAAIAVAGGCKHEHEENETTIQQSEVPSATMDAFNRDHPGATVTKTEREVEKDGSVHYEIKYRTSDGKTDKVEYDAMGMKAHED